MLDSLTDGLVYEVMGTPLWAYVALVAIGDYSNHDASGWARLASHSCDNSGGHSGGPIYQWIYDPNTQSSWPAVSLIISHMPGFVNDFDCANNSRPYRATRLTPEYVNQLIFMLSWKP